MSELKSPIAKILPQIRELRRELHAHPEPGYQEVETSRRVAALIESLPGFELRRNVATTGLVATLDRDKPGPCVALRADMDCLPIQEETSLPYASRRAGYMHACGHDGHTASLVGAALILALLRDQLAGPVKFLFQPAEEGGAGARQMVAEGALEDPHVTAIFGLHNMPATQYALGDVVLRAGPFMGGTTDFSIVVHGRGGHAAMPHLTIDPIFVGAQIVQALQGIVSRGTDPISTLVITVGKFHAGTATNVIPDSATIEGTIRSLSPATLEGATDRLSRLAESVAAAHGATAEFTIHPGYPVTVNHDHAAAYVAEVARAVAGDGRVNADCDPILGAEDFAYYLQARPGCFYFLGTRPTDVPEVPSCHHPKFDFNDDVLPLAIEMHCEIARRFVTSWKQ